MKLFRRFTNKGECKNLKRKISGEQEYLLYAQLNCNGASDELRKRWFYQWQKMRHWQQQLSK